MRRSLLLLPCVLLLGSVLFAPSMGAGQLGGAVQARTTLAGTWRYAGAPEEGTSIVRQAVEPVVGQLRPDLQPVARERIAESTWLPTRIRIGARGGRLEVALSGPRQRTFASVIGRPIQVPMRSGEYAQLIQGIRDDGGLEQAFVAIDGTQQNLYLPGPDRTMLLDVTLESPVLRNAIHFQLEYQRGR